MTTTESVTIPTMMTINRLTIRMRPTPVRLALVALALVAVSGVWPAPAARVAMAAQKPAPPPSVRLYLFDVGRINIADPQRLFNFKKEELQETNLSVAAYLIAHPKGTLMWDTGFVPDSAIGAGRGGAGIGTASRRLKDQLAEAGYQPSDIDYLAVSHYHGDHTGNANDFASATWLVSQVERDLMFNGAPLDRGTPATFRALENSKTVILDLSRNYDVFGDGSVIIMPTPGHTPGHLVLIVKLANTGPVMLTGDLYHYPEELTRDVDQPLQGDPVLLAAAKKKVQEYVAETGTALWISHDLVGFSKLKKAPQYYD